MVRIPFTDCSIRLRDRTDQHRIDGTQQKAPGHPQGASHLKGKQHEQREYDDGEYHHPTSGQGTTGCVQGIPIEMQGRGKYGQHGVFARRQLRIKEKFLRPEKPFHPSKADNKLEAHWEVKSIHGPFSHSAGAGCGLGGGIDLSIDVIMFFH
jgi:hypothetical protein